MGFLKEERFDLGVEGKSRISAVQCGEGRKGEVRCVSAQAQRDAGGLTGRGYEMYT